MSLRGDLQADLADAYGGDLADAITVFTGERTVIFEEYDPQEGSYPKITQTYTGRGVMSDYRVNEVDGQHILSTDTKLIGVLQSQLLGEAGEVIAPAIDDMIDGLRVLDVAQDPAKATWTLQLRKT